MNIKTASLVKRLLAFMVAAAMALTCIPMVGYVHASSYPYDTQAERATANQKMYDLAASSHSSSTVLARYQDKSLKDMYETDEKGMTSSQMTTIKNKANEIIADRAAELGKGSLTDYEKLRAFHDWIIEHYYYYREVDRISSQCDNPYYLITTEYKNSANDGYGKIRSRCNGYTSVLIAFARSQGIPARAVDGTYNTEARRYETGDFFEKSTISITHHWAQAYADRDGDGTKEWIIIDCNADCWNQYKTSGEYTQGGNFSGMEYEMVREAYFDPSAERLAQSHIIMEYRAGSKDIKYLSNSTEIKKLKTFLNKKYNGKTNGKRLRSNYSSSKVSTWFPASTSKAPILGDGNGNLYKLYLPSSKSLYGSLDLSNFKGLQNFKCEKNKLTKLYLKNCPKLSTVAVSNNKITRIDTTGSKNITMLSAQGNPTTYVAYSFNKSRKAIIKSNYSKRGTVFVKYTKSGSKHKHTMKAVAKKGYKFKGWYSGSKRVSSKTSYTTTKSSSFTYTAKFVKR